MLSCRRTVISAVAVLPALVAACGRPTVSPAEARAIANGAYTYGYPMVDNYRIMHAYFVDTTNPEYKGPFNTIVNTARVYTSDDHAVQTPNSDTPYSWLGMDLRAEPLVLTVPAIEPARYFSIQLIDLYTHNFDYIGTRTTGNGAGSYLIAGPHWKGELPAGVTKVIRSETELGLALYRTQLFNPGDLENVKRIQAGFKVQPLSAFLGQPAPKAPSPIAFVAPLTVAEQRSSPRVFEILNFLLAFCPTHPSEEALMQRFALIGVGAGRRLDVARLAPEQRQALEGGIADAWAAFDTLVKRANAGELTSAEVFGTRDHLANNYGYRMLGAVLGIYGNSAEEALYPVYRIDADGAPLDGSKRYTLRFAPGQEPPVHAFWSLTMYQLPSSLLVPNPLNRYLLNSSMAGQFRRDADGGVTLRIQHESPGKGWEANWLPAPRGPFTLILRLYLPKPAALEGTWQAPPLMRAR